MSRCRVCFDDKPDLISLDCGHQCCKNCLDQQVRFFLDPKTFPPMCCGRTISIYKHSGSLYHSTLRRYLRHRLKMARKDNIPCASARCKGGMISHHLIEDEWGLCGKCCRMTCGRCHCSIIRHRGNWGARICPVIVNLTSSDSKLKEAPKLVVPQHCSKCDKLVPEINNQTTMPCPCGAIICRGCTEIQQQKRGLLLFGCWCEELASSNSVANERPSKVVDPAASLSKTTGVSSSIKPESKTYVAEQVCKGTPVADGPDLKNQIPLPQSVVLPFQQPQLTQNLRPVQYPQHTQQPRFMQAPQVVQVPQLFQNLQQSSPAQHPR